MQFARASVVIVFVVVMLSVSGWARTAEPPAQSISGKLIFEDGRFPCDPCGVTLLVSGVQRVAMTYTDAAGNFTFNDVRPGTYTIHVELSGYEGVDQQVDVTGGLGFGMIVTMMPNRRPGTSNDSTDGAPGVVDASQFLNTYPKKAIESFKKGLENKKKGKNDQAVKNFEVAAEVAPNFYDAHNELGQAYKQAGRPDDAEREFLRAHELNQTSAEPLIRLTGLYIDENKPDRAVITGEEAVKADSRSASAFLNLGMALYKATMLDRAEAALKKALGLAPNLFQARLMLANVYLKEQRYDDLLEQLDRYLADNPNGEQRESVQQMRQALLKAKQEARP